MYGYDEECWNGTRHVTCAGSPRGKGKGHLTHLAGSCEAHAVGEDARELDVSEQDPVQEEPTDPQKDSQTVVTFLAHCVAQHEGPVRVIGGIEAHSRRNDDLEDDDEVEGEAKLPRGG